MKLDYIKAQSAKIEQLADPAAAALAEELLAMLCDTWGYPLPEEIGCYQMRRAAYDRHSITVHLRDKASGVSVEGRGTDEVAARANALRRLRVALTPEQRGICFPKRDSLHLAICTCANAYSPRLATWDDDDDLECVLGSS